MRRLARDIPSSFIRLDSAVTSQDRFLNVRDMQVARQNHNKLVSLTSVRQAFTAQMTFGSSSSYTIAFNPFYVGGSRGQMSPPLIRSRILLSPYLKYVRVNATVSGSKVNSNVNLYPVLSRPGVQRPVAADETLAVNGGAVGYSNIKTTVPGNGIQVGGWEEYEFALFVNPTSIGNVISGPLAIASVGTGYISVATASLAGTEAVGDLMYFDNAAGTTPYVRPRIVCSTVVVGANTWFLTLWPWPSNAPTAGTTRVYFKECSALQIWDLCVNEEPPTSFDETTNWI